MEAERSRIVSGSHILSLKGRKYQEKILLDPYS
jgi:hypothetical protein